MKMIESYRKNGRGILLMTVSAMLVCIGQLCWKLSYTKGYWLLLIGFFLYSLGALVMLIAYKYGSLSVLQPILSIGYVFAFIIGFFLLKENINMVKLISIFSIIIGVIFIGGGDD